MFISFIVPCYNIEKYVAACIDSLLDQDIDLNEYEIICVNDGSADDTLAVLRQYEKVHRNILVIDQKNAGVCAARNAGLKMASGDYIWFVDADDCIEHNCLAMLKSRISESRPDRVVINNYSFPDGENPCQGTERWKTNTIWQDSSVWRSIFRRGFLQQNDLYFRYPELIYGEDALFMYEVKWEKPDTITIDPPLYYYRERAGSASRDATDKSNRKRLHSTIREAEIMKHYYDAGRRDTLTTDRMMSYLYGALLHIASMSRQESRAFLARLREAGLFPFRRPRNCTIRKSYYVNRGGTWSSGFTTLFIDASVPAQVILPCVAGMQYSA